MIEKEIYYYSVDIDTINVGGVLETTGFKTIRLYEIIIKNGKSVLFEIISFETLIQNDSEEIIWNELSEKFKLDSNQIELQKI